MAKKERSIGLSTINLNNLPRIDRPEMGLQLATSAGLPDFNIGVT